MCFTHLAALDFDAIRLLYVLEPSFGLTRAVRLGGFLSIIAGAIVVVLLVFRGELDCEEA